MNAEQKALRACADYARLTHEIAELKRKVGNHLSKCPGMHGYLLTDSAYADNQTLAKMNADCTHLKAAYTPEVESSPVDHWNVYMTDAEIREYLAVCPHCLAAHEAVQARKAARRSLGATKRFIGMLGRAAAKAAA
jgi:hypothetical protein